jgi:hypothetical protein
LDLRSNKSIENVSKVQICGSDSKNQNCIHEAIKSRLDSGNACYHSVQNPFLCPISFPNLYYLQFYLLFCKSVTLGLTLTEEHRLSVFVDRIHLAQDRDQWCALVNMVMNLQVPQKAGNFLTS